RIDLHYGPQQTTESDRNSQSSQAANSASNQAEVGQDQTRFSGAHAQVQALAAQAVQLPEVRQDKVDALRQAIQSGQYQADPQQTAGALFTQMQCSPARS
ncbi:MAG: flagellar biosynthesis anti-sigma factor FlgM, partial [Candidatus Sulfotelmatobacter sp.]